MIRKNQNNNNVINAKRKINQNILKEINQQKLIKLFVFSLKLRNIL